MTSIVLWINCNESQRTLGLDDVPICMNKRSFCAASAIHEHEYRSSTYEHPEAAETIDVQVVDVLVSASSCDGRRSRAMSRECSVRCRLRGDKESLPTTQFTFSCLLLTYLYSPPRHCAFKNCSRTKSRKSS